MEHLGRLLFVLFFGSAGAFLAWATRKAMRRRQVWLVDGLVVDGEVVGFKEDSRTKSRSAGRIPVAPIVSFRAAGAEGETRRFTSADASWPNPFALGQKVRVRYLAGDPRSMELDAVALSRRFILATATLSLACLAATLVPILVLVLGLRR